MKESPDYSKYSVDELLDVFFHIDHSNFPDRVKSIKNELKKHKVKIPSLNNRDEQKAFKITEEKQSLEPNTAESDNGNNHLTVFVLIAISAVIWIFLPDKITNFLSWKKTLSELLFNSFNRLGIDQLYGTTLFL